MGFLSVSCFRSFSNVGSWCSYRHKYASISFEFKIILGVVLALFFCLYFLRNYVLLHAGVFTDPVAPSSFGAWMSYASTHHIGALSFLIADFSLFFGVAVLTAVQASQVCL